jgi:hypothetical protein
MTSSAPPACARIDHAERAAYEQCIASLAGDTVNPARKRQQAA